MSFAISVIIPVYNAQNYVEMAIRSALNQPEVKEVVVVNDGSTDDSQGVIHILIIEDSRVKLFLHSNNQNLGRAASKNLGIKKASCPFIAFLDADDYYLENRFENDNRIFENNLDIDGVYNAIGVHFYRETTTEERARLELTTIKYPVSPNELFDEMSPKGDAGYFSGDGLTVKTSIFQKVGLFNENLEVAEDTHMWIKMALKANLAAGILKKPVSIRGVHETNVFQLYGTTFYNKNMAKMFNSLLDWSYNNRLNLKVLEYFWRNTYINYKYLRQVDGVEKSKDLSFIDWFKYAIKHPRLLKLKYFHYTNPLIQFYKKRIK